MILLQFFNGHFGILHGSFDIPKTKSILLRYSIRVESNCIVPLYLVDKSDKLRMRLFKIKIINNEVAVYLDDFLHEDFNCNLRPPFKNKKIDFVIEYKEREILCNGNKLLRIYENNQPNYNTFVPKFNTLGSENIDIWIGDTPNYKGFQDKTYIPMCMSDVRGCMENFEINGLIIKLNQTGNDVYNTCIKCRNNLNCFSGVCEMDKNYNEFCDCTNSWKNGKDCNKDLQVVKNKKNLESTIEYKKRNFLKFKISWKISTMQIYTLITFIFRNMMISLSINEGGNLEVVIYGNKQQTKESPCKFQKYLKENQNILFVTFEKNSVAFNCIKNSNEVEAIDVRPELNAKIRLITTHANNCLIENSFVGNIDIVYKEYKQDSSWIDIPFSINNRGSLSADCIHIRTPTEAPVQNANIKYIIVGVVIFIAVFIIIAVGVIIYCRKVIKKKYEKIPLRMKQPESSRNGNIERTGSIQGSTTSLNTTKSGGYKQPYIAMNIRMQMNESKNSVFNPAHDAHVTNSVV